MNTAHRSRAMIALFVLSTAVLTVVDLWSKDMAAAALPCDPAQVGNCRAVPGWHPSRAGVIELVPGYLDLSYAENRGAAFGILREAPEALRIGLFTLAAGVACVVMSFMFVVGYGGVLYAWSVPLILSGALGNLIDRYRFGYVVDFIRFHLHDGWEYPTFNVADITIAIGGGLLLLDSFRKTPHAHAATAEANT